MTKREKLFNASRSQAVRLPGKHRFEGKREVPMRRRGRAVVMETVPLRGLKVENWRR